MSTLPSIGVDLGNVIIDHKNFGTTENYVLTQDYNLIPPVTNALEALRKLNESRFMDRVFIIYNASEIIDSKIFGWLNYNDFFRQTGIDKGHVLRSNTGRKKNLFCKNMQLTHFVDDRLEVLNCLMGLVPNLYLLNGQWEEIKKHGGVVHHVNFTSCWNEIADLIL
jgi:hypothetical protein